MTTSSRSVRHVLLIICATVCAGLTGCTRSHSLQTEAAPAPPVELRLEVSVPFRFVAYGDTRFHDPKDTEASNPPVRQALVQAIVSFENTNTFSTAPIFGDIDACNLAGVSWVIPDMKWSDHPGAQDNQGLGPDYVANLLDTIGESPCTNPNDGKSYWNSTAIFIVWDDWGGWYDHVNPSTAPGLGVRESCSTSSWGCGYTYGFRVPLLVVSAYTGIKNQNGTYSGYVSGNTITQGEVFPYIHDFGSILGFIEHNFNVGFINPAYEFADFYAPDGAGGNTPLADFFGLTTPRPYTPITVYHPVSYYTNNPAGPQGPGDGGSED